jgi:hypothetical protein
MLNNIEFKTNDLQASNSSFNKDILFKLSRHDAVLNKLENDNANALIAIKDIQSRQQDGSRTLLQRVNEIENRVGILFFNSSFFSKT